MRIPQFPEILAMARCRGKDSAWPDGWKNLAAMWPLGYGSLNARDVSGGGYHMTAVNTPTRSVGRLGPCVVFGGNDEHLLVNVVPFTTYPFTLSAWGKSDDDSASQVILWIGDKDEENGMLGFITFAGDDANDPVRAARYNENLVEAFSTSGYSVNQWHHVAGVFESTGVAVFLDGGNKGTDGTTPNNINTADRISIGRAMDSTPTSGFSGSIAFPTMWSDAKTDEFVRYHKERGWWEMVSERPLAISMYGKAPASGGGPEGRLVGGKLVGRGLLGGRLVA